MTKDDTDIDEALRSLPLEREPPSDLHARVRERLRSDRLLAASGSRPWLRRAWAAAAVAVLAFLGGRATAVPSPLPADEGSGPLWVFLLYEDDRFDTGGRLVTEVVALYDRWADDARRDGALVLAEKLGTERVVVATPGPAPTDGDGPHGELSGLFVVRAADARAAADMARSLPHARFGGTVVVRSVDPT